MQPSVVLIVGFPGTGKYTVGKALVAELAKQGQQARLVDNHHVNNTLFGVIPVDGKTELPDRVWDLVRDVRAAVLSAIEELAPRDWTFVFTNYIHAEEAHDEAVVAYVERLRSLAASRGTTLTLVRLTCERDELLRRVVRPERSERLKATSAEWAAAEIDAHRLYDNPALTTLTLDVTDLSPEEAARRITAL